MATVEACECGDSPLGFARSVVRKCTLGAFYQNGRHDRCNDLLRTSRGSAPGTPLRVLVTSYDGINISSCYDQRSPQHFS
jgi:hypothetical protein